MIGTLWMEIRHLKTFCTVSALLSFSRAAEQLNYTQSSVSAQIKSLEEDLKVKLFDRLGKRILLTEAGDQLLQYANKILSLTEETRAAISGDKEPQGSLTIRIPETFGTQYLPTMLKSFGLRFPKVNLSFTTCAHEGLTEDLRKGITDLSFLLTDSFQSADLEMRRISFESIRVVSGPTHPLASKKKWRSKDFIEEPILLSKADCSYRKIFEAILEKDNIHPKALIEFNSVAVLKQCVMEGFGISILPERGIAEDISKGRLCVLPWEHDPMEVALLMIWYKNRWLSPTLKAFMDVIHRHLTKINAKTNK